VAVGECRRKVLSVSCRGYPPRVELDQQLGFEFDGIISSDDFSVYNGYQQDPNRNVWHICGASKSGQGLVFNPALGQEFLDLIDEALLNIGSGEKPRMRALIKIGQWGSSRG